MGGRGSGGGRRGGATAAAEPSAAHGSGGGGSGGGGRQAPTAQELIANAPTMDELDNDPSLGNGQIQQLGDIVDGTYAGFRVEVTSGVIASDAENAIFMSGTIYDSHGIVGTPVGEFERVIQQDLRTGELTAHHELLTLYPHVQGSGFAEEFNARLYDWYRQSGIAKVETFADINVGGYTWAVKGFDFANSWTARDYVSESLKKVNAALTGRDVFENNFLKYSGGIPSGLTREGLESLKAYLTDVSQGSIPASAPDIARFGREAGQGGKDAIWPGKWLMLGSSWNGVLYL